MSIACIDSRAILGMDSPKVSVEVHVSNGLPSFSIVGLPEASVKESKDRVRSALLSSGFQLPPKRITVNLAPADLPKVGGRYDLPIALGILFATEQLKVETLTDFEVYGELALTGELRAINGTISSLFSSFEHGKKIILPKANLKDVELVLNTNPEMADSIYVVNNLREACQALLGQVECITFSTRPVTNETVDYDVDLADVVGQSQAKRALEIAASGEHSMLMVGPPGAGKSMLASRLVTLLPNMNGTEAIEVAKIRSLAGVLPESESYFVRTIVQPHHTASAAAMVGGGSSPKPGALSLAHKGVLFLDELPEFNRAVLEALREPLETKRVNISRVQQHVTYPADSLLVAAMNPSPSGYFPDDSLGRCKDTPDQILRYQKKVSGPLMDRIDMHIEVPAVEIKALRSQQPVSETSKEVRVRVERVRALQLNRQGCLNSALSGSELKDVARFDNQAEALLDKAVEDLGLSARGYHRVLRIARTIADMEQAANIQVSHLAEALSYRATSKAFQ